MGEWRAKCGVLRWQVVTSIIVVLLVSIIIRCHGSTTMVLSRDESSSWRMTRYSFTELTSRLKDNVHPPLHYFLLKAWTHVAGTSPGALRGLSVVFAAVVLVLLPWLVWAAAAYAADGGKGVSLLGIVGRIPSIATEPMGAAVANEQTRLPPQARIARPAGARGGIHGPWEHVVLVFMCFTGLHAGCVQAGAAARMYSLGMLWAVLSALLLLLALRSRHVLSVWWPLYGVTAALFCYTHYFGLFTVLAQALYAVDDRVRRRKSGFGGLLSACGGVIAAVGIAFLLFSPWVSVLRGQVADIQRKWWVAAITYEEVEKQLFCWLTGVTCEPSTYSRLWMVFTVGVGGWMLWHGSRVAWFFFLQALVPWVCTLGYFLVFGRSLLVDRCLVFSLVGLFGFWAVTLCELCHSATRVLLCGVLMLPCLIGLFSHLAGMPTDSLPIEQAAAWLCSHYRHGDVFVVDDYRDINRVRYYCLRSGLPWLEIRALVDPFHRGHLVHIATLSGEEIYWGAMDQQRSQGRTWQVHMEADPLVPHRVREGDFCKSFGCGSQGKVTFALGGRDK